MNISPQNRAAARAVRANPLLPVAGVLTAAAVAWTTYSVWSLLGHAAMAFVAGAVADLMWAGVLFLEWRRIPLCRGHMWTTHLAGWLLLAAVATLLTVHGYQQWQMAGVIAGPLLSIGTKLLWHGAIRVGHDPTALTESEAAELDAMLRAARFEAEQRRIWREITQSEHDDGLASIQMDAERAMKTDRADFAILQQRHELTRELARCAPLALPPMEVAEQPALPAAPAAPTAEAELSEDSLEAEQPAEPVIDVEAARMAARAYWYRYAPSGEMDLAHYFSGPGERRLGPPSVARISPLDDPANGPQWRQEDGSPWTDGWAGGVSDGSSETDEDPPETEPVVVSLQPPVSAVSGDLQAPAQDPNAVFGLHLSEVSGDPKTPQAGDGIRTERLVFGFGLPPEAPAKTPESSKTSPETAETPAETSKSSETVDRSKRIGQLIQAGVLKRAEIEKVLKAEGYELPHKTYINRLIRDHRPAS